ncbi:MAG: class I SAM-dependent methyltransferase [Methanothrix sp.]|nr:class I SAM-dependent methyltransferase [Methanothrix sp.]MDD4446782.1 class I SAM-dependent methyltransferase [Methanothrix sp.]
MQKADTIAKLNDTEIKTKGPSKMAELIALQRFVESALPERERICYDPYAIHFVDMEMLEFARKNPEKAKAMRENYERLFPGIGNSIRARVRYFDDFVRTSIDEGIKQMVILGAGYDTRAYRIEGLKCKVRTFEVDHPSTQDVKIRIINKIFGALPNHVVYVPLDFESEDLGQKLLEYGYDKSQKTLFVMEGLVMYISPDAMDETLSFIVRNSGKESSIIFDYYPKSLVDGTSELEAAKNIYNFLVQQGEPLKFGIEEEMLETFLTQRGFSRVQSITSEDYKRAYFHGINENRAVSSLLFLAHAVVG